MTSYRLRPRAGRSLLTLPLVLLGLAFTSACGGGGGGDTGTAYTVTLSPSTVHFTAPEFDTLPALQVVHATYTGEGMVVGYPAGMPTPSWLTVGTAAGAGKSVDVNLRPNATFISRPGAPPYAFATTLRFVTGRNDGTQLSTVDLPITYTITRGLVMNTLPITAQCTQGQNPATNHYDLALSASVGVSWTVTTNQAWLVPSMTAGSGSPLAVYLDLETATLPVGTYEGTVTAQSTDGALVKSFTVHLTVQ